MIFVADYDVTFCVHGKGCVVKGERAEELTSRLEACVAIDLP